MRGFCRTCEAIGTALLDPDDIYSGSQRPVVTTGSMKGTEVSE